MKQTPQKLKLQKITLAKLHTLITPNLKKAPTVTDRIRVSIESSC